MMYSSVGTIWLLICAALVFFMQAGFSMMEAGSVRFKNSGNIIMKNLMNLSIGAIVFCAVGFRLMFQGSSDGFKEMPSSAFLIFQAMLCVTMATIASGAMAERTKFLTYLLITLIISGVVYPISGYWIWNSAGWLKQLGFHDFSGGTAVHLAGGMAALAGAKILGPRIGKYKKDGSSRAIPGHSITLGALGIFIVWFCWFGFNGGAIGSFAANETLVTAADIFLVTNLAAAAAAVSAMTVTWKRYGKPDISLTLNGVPAGLAAITAGCDQVSPLGAVLIGAAAGFVMVFGIEIIDKKFHIDDPVGASSVHGLCGALGTVLTGLFSVEYGALYVKGGWSFLGIQCLGVMAVMLYVGIIMTVAYKVIDKAVGLRVSAEAETAGLDLKEHGLNSTYDDFMTAKAAVELSGQPAIPLDVSDIPSDNASIYKADGKIRNVVVIMNQNRFEALKAALDKIDITGMTVTYVSGCGIQKGSTEYYRGSEYESHLLPKVKVEIVISTVPVGLLVDTIKKTIYTGKIGDGKIFIYEAENVIKVRTGEEGVTALE